MIQLHLRLPSEVVENIENVMEGATTTEKVRNFICSNIIGRDMLLLEQERCKTKLEFIKKALTENPFYGEQSYPEGERKFLEETLGAIERRPEFKNNPPFFHTRRKMYNEKFLASITTKEFELLLYRFKDTLEEEKEKKVN